MARSFLVGGRAGLELAVVVLLRLRRPMAREIGGAGWAAVATVMQAEAEQRGAAQCGVIGDFFIVLSEWAKILNERGGGKACASSWRHSAWRVAFETRDSTESFGQGEEVGRMGHPVGTFARESGGPPTRVIGRQVIKTLSWTHTN